MRIRRAFRYSRAVTLSLLLMACLLKLEAAPWAVGIMAGDPLGLGVEFRLSPLMTVRAAAACDLISPGGPLIRTDLVLGPLRAGDFQLALGIFGLKQTFLIGDGRYGTAADRQGTSLYLPIIGYKVLDGWPLKIFIEAVAGLRLKPTIGFEPSLALGLLWLVP